MNVIEYLPYARRGLASVCGTRLVFFGYSLSCVFGMAWHGIAKRSEA